jgi:hypothetical protein
VADLADFRVARRFILPILPEIDVRAMMISPFA